MAVRGIRKKNNHSPVKYNVNSLVSFAKEKGLIENDKLDINTLVNELGLNLKFQILPPDVSGKLQKFNGQWTIIVNKSHSTNRQRYTIAHELNKIKHVKFIFSRELMPENAIESAINQGINTLSDLSIRFGVSLIAIKNRLLSLNYKLVSNE